MSEPDGSRRPTEDDLDRMTVEQLSRYGAQLDDVAVVDDRPRVAPDSREEKRAERRVSAWFVLAALAGVGFVVVFVAWPWQYQGVGPRAVLTSWYTPMLGLTFALCVLSLAAGLVLYSKTLVPPDIAVQQHHDGASSPENQRTAAARFVEIQEQTGVRRRGLLRRTVLASGTALAGVLAVTFVGAFVRNPWDKGTLSPLLVTGWRSPDGERTYLRTDTGDPHSVTLVRPEDVVYGGLLNVYPFRESERGDPERLSTVLRSSDDVVILLRFFPGTPVVQRAGQEDFHYGDLYAYSRICTHMGCPTGMFEEITLRIVCPCHQTEFQANEYARPVFGPAARPLPQLPLDVDERGYLYARRDFIEPIGPGFWERRPNA